MFETRREQLKRSAEAARRAREPYQDKVTVRDQHIAEAYLDDGMSEADIVREVDLAASHVQKIVARAELARQRETAERLQLQ